MRERALRRLSPTADATRQWAGSIALAIVVGLLYFLAARLSLALLTEPDGVAVFWPAAGIAAGALIALGPSARLSVAVGIMAATIVANLLGDRSFPSTIAFALCNAGESLLVAWLIEHYFGSSFSLNKLRHVLGLIAAAVVACAASGIGGTLTFKVLHGSTAPILTTWQHWFASDALGIVAVAPLIVGLAAAARAPPPPRELVEGVVALVALAVMSGLVISLPPDPLAAVLRVALLFPLLLWLAARSRPVFAAAAAFIIAISTVGTATFGIGHFANSDLPVADHILAAQAGILVSALCAFVLAALFAERRQHEAALIESEARLQEALTAGAVTAFEWDVGTRSSRRSENAAQMLGFDPQQPFNATRFLEGVHPDDRARFKAHVYSVRAESPSYAITFRFIRPDGREVWLEESSRAEFDAAGRYVRLKGLTIDITERKRAEERQLLLIAELDHRVKNVLARVAVVAMYTREGSNSMDEFVQALDGRIQSLAQAHALLSQSHWYGVNFAELVRLQLAPYAVRANTTIGGPDTTLNAAATEAMAMVLQELVTNAAKYGALSTKGGRVSVIWERQNYEETTASLTINWLETGGPPVTAPTHSGYGTSLIRDLIPHELGGAVDLVFPTDGVRCKIEIPIGPEKATITGENPAP